MGKRGPKATPIDWQAVKKLAALHCTQEEIAHFLNISVDTLYLRAPKEQKHKLGDLIKEWSADGKVSLRRWQWKSAQDGSETMQIWLGKQYLGQTNNGLRQTESTASPSAEKEETEQLVKWLTELDKT